MNGSFHFQRFKALNYTLGNEDNLIEHDLLAENLNHVMTVAGSGSRVLALLAKSPGRITCVDTAREQLQITELRIAGARRLTYQEYLSFWDYPGASPLSAAGRKEMFYGLDLAPVSRRALGAAFDAIRWESMLYTGRFERLLRQGTLPARALMGKDWLRIFECRDIGEQRRFFWTEFPRRRLDGVIRAHSWVHDVFFRMFPSVMRRNISETYHAFFRRVFYSLFTEEDAKSSLLLQLYFCGKLMYIQAAPPECDPFVFERIKRSLGHCRITYLNDSVFGTGRIVREPVDFLSLSNVPSYLTGDLERSFMRDLRPMLADRALVVTRSHLHVPEGTDLDGYDNVTANHGDPGRRERTRLYQIDVFRKTF
ncbi:MAG: DUF3419 family protein [Verrucomicrobia bacterium]|nr:DUF3419 family protein [Verrucomicrobiota bacterium]